MLALFLLGLAFPLPAGTTTALIAGVALLPVWAAQLPRFRGATPIAALTAFGLVSGLLLARWSSADHELAPHQAAETGFLVVAALGLVGTVLWARTVLPLPWIGVAFGMGQLVIGILRAPGSENAVKFDIGLPLAFVLLALVSGRRRPALSLAALAAIALLHITHDARSAFGFCVVAGALVLWQARPHSLRARTNRWAAAALLGAVGVGGYFALSELLLAGALGAQVQHRTATQIAQSGSLLLGGRPEWTATWALMHDSPIGFGLGTVPAAGDVTVAKSAIEVTRIPTVDGYLEHYLLAGRFELHSIVADLWSNLGPAGLALGLVLLLVLIRGLADRVARRAAQPLVSFAVLAAVWYLPFGPLPSNLLQVAFAVGLVLGARRPSERSATAGEAKPELPAQPAVAAALP